MTAAVVNHLKFAQPVDPSVFRTAEVELTPQLRTVAGFGGMHVVQVADDEAILVILADTADTLNTIATEIGSPWMVANVLPLLTQPPQRHIGPAIASIHP